MNDEEITRVWVDLATFLGPKLAMEIQTLIDAMVARAQRNALNEAVETVVAEGLYEGLDHPEDLAYQSAIDDAANAVRELREKLLTQIASIYTQDV